ncbi:MAG: Sec-independent protein translocase protein TatB [Silicimonas sp.]|nr:Sec-independent protein translocase protein TatB [Silicimonas sp.]
MFDLSWGELLIIGVVALIILGPRDLVGMFRTLGRMTGKVRRMAREFQRAMEDAADEAGIKETAQNLKGMTNPSKMGLDKLNEAADKFDKWDPTKPSKKATETGPNTAKLSEERAEAAKKIHEYSAQKAAEKRAAEAEAEAAEAETPAPEDKPEDKA